MKIYSPAEGYTGKDMYGETVLDFVDGVADFDGDLPIGIQMYLTGAGYGLGSKKAVAPPETPEPADPREVGDGVVVGTRLRDAAVDPEPGDFLPPINAGQENPHGSKVVSPEIHASGPAGILPGNAFVEDPEKQAARETEFAKARLVDQTPASEAVADAVPDVEDFGPLGLSDPGSVAQGVEAAKEVAAAEAKESDEPETTPAPAKKTAAKKTAAKKS